MILTLLFAGIVILGLILIKIADMTNADTDAAGQFVVVSGLFFLTVAIFLIVTAHATAKYTIQENKIKYEGLQNRYEIITSEYEDMSKSDVIRDITEWNIKVYHVKYWAESPWTNWFNPRQIADNLEYIPLQ